MRSHSGLWNGNSVSKSGEGGLAVYQLSTQTFTAEGVVYGFTVLSAHLSRCDYLLKMCGGCELLRNAILNLSVFTHQISSYP